MKVLYSFVFLFMGTILFATGQTKCNPEVEFFITENSPSNFSISLRALGVLTNPQFELYDLNEGKVVQTKQLNIGVRNKQEVFFNVRPSRYIVYIKQAGCKTAESIGGVQGIKVGIIE